MFLKIADGGATIGFHQLAPARKESSDWVSKAHCETNIGYKERQLSVMKVWWQKDFWSARESSSEQASGFNLAAVQRWCLISTVDERSYNIRPNQIEFI